MNANRLLRALARSAEAHGCAPELDVACQRDWASAVFVGARFDVVATLEPGEAAERWIAALPDSELAMPRQYANEVRVTARTDTGELITLTIEALVLEE